MDDKLHKLSEEKIKEIAGGTSGEAASHWGIALIDGKAYWVDPAKKTPEYHFGFRCPVCGGILYTDTRLYVYIVSTMIPYGQMSRFSFCNEVCRNFLKDDNGNWYDTELVGNN